jgi:hypothetical protein
MHRDFSGGVDTEANFVACDANHFDDDVVVNDDLFVALPGENQHACGPGWAAGKLMPDKMTQVPGQSHFAKWNGENPLGMDRKIGPEHQVGCQVLTRMVVLESAKMAELTSQEITQALEQLPDRPPAKLDSLPESIKRLTALAEGARSAAETLQRHGLNGLSSLDNVHRLYADVCLVQFEYDKQIKPRTWTVRIGDLTRQKERTDLYMARRNKPICRNCSNWIGFVFDKDLQGVVRMIGRQFQEMKVGDLVKVPRLRGALIKRTEMCIMVIARIEGLTVYLDDIKAKPPACETTDARRNQTTGG